MNKHYYPQTGAALIAALLIIAIIAAIASDVVSRLQIDIRRTNLVLSAQQAELSITYSLAWAQSIYMAQAPPPPSNTLTPLSSLDLPLIMPTFVAKNTTVNANLSSAQGRFNLNNLTTPAYIPLFAKLIQTVDSKLDTEQSNAIAIDTAYFIGEKINSQTEQFYATLIPAYRPSHRLMVSPSELRLVKGVTAELYQKLAPYIIALPKSTTVDPSAASKAVLISYGLTEEAANSVIRYVQNQAFKNINEFYGLANFAGQIIAKKALFALQNQYFFLTSTIKAGKIDWIIYSILQIDKTNGKLTIVQQSRNTL